MTTSDTDPLSDRFMAEVESIADIGGWEYDYESETLRWTEGTKQLMGVPSADDVSLDEAFEFFHHEDRRALESAFSACISDGQPYSLEVRIVTADEQTRWVRSRGRRYEAESVIRGSIVDITTEKRRRQQLSVLNRILRHNLRNNLNLVKGYADHLQQTIGGLEPPSTSLDALEANIDELASGIHTADSDLEALSHIIREFDRIAAVDVDTTAGTIQDMSEELIELGRKANEFAEWVEDHIETRPVDVAPPVTEVVETIRDEHPAVTLTLDLTASTIDADPVGVRLLVDEAIRNAIRHNPSNDPMVDIMIRDGPNRAHIVVEDNGPGIPNEELTVLDGEETALEHSSGIGLWIMNWIVTNYGGDIHVSDRSPHGTILNISLPRATE